MTASMQRVSTALLVVAAGAALTAFVWWPLWRGGGFVGGDVYSYYLPQKVVYAQHLRSGEFPLWNNRAGHGYPLVGESQTGPFYPFHLLLYTTLDVNTAYNVNHLLHYVLTFCFTWLYARTIGMSVGAALLAAGVFTYAWFPPRNCWEWAIIGGAWLPLTLWCVERFAASRHGRYAVGLALVLAIQMLAGHFNLAFMTQLAVAAYAPPRLLMQGGNGRLSESTETRRMRALAVLAAAGVLAFAVAAVQLIPTWELKLNSQRESAGTHHNLAHGSIPPWYWSQIVRPWHWYSISMDRDAELRKSQPELGAPTNQVEAHLYFGLVPLGLAILGVVQAIGSRDVRRWLWIVLGTAAFFYTSGWFLPAVRHLPGFNFFQGPGRFGMLTTFAVALLAGDGFDRLCRSPAGAAAVGVTALLAGSLWSVLTLTAEAQQAAELEGVDHRFYAGPLAITDELVSGILVAVSVLGLVAAYLLFAGRGRPAPRRLAVGILAAGVTVAVSLDLWVVSRLNVNYSEMVADAPIDHLHESPVGRLLAEESRSVRLFAPGANLPTVLGVASTPVYLTFGPAAYVDPKRTMPAEESAEQIRWLRRAGVTHVLSFEPLSDELWPVEQIWRGFDPLLNPAWARYGADEPLYLYRLQDSPGRVVWSDASVSATAVITSLGANRVEIEADSPNGGRLVLKDLMYPGWRVTVDGEPARAIEHDGMFRAVDVPPGRHAVVWAYRPSGVYWGAVISGAGLVLLACVGTIRLWRPRWLPGLD